MNARLSKRKNAGGSVESPRQMVWFPLLFGLLLGLALLKFGNAVVMESYVETPSGVYELLFASWPAVWGYVGLAVVALSALPHLRSFQGAFGLILLPAAWLFWQIVAATGSISLELSLATIVHFGCCVACFYLGLLVLSRTDDPRPLWLPIIAAFVIMLGVGLHQHFGGLEATRRYFYLYIYPQLADVAPEYLRKIASDRIFSTLFYPNTFAGAMLLYFPMATWATWELSSRRFTTGARRFLVGMIVAATMGCLYWSGSKAGWLLMLLLGLVAVLHLRLALRIKLGIVAAVLLLGLTGFFVKYAGFFQSGATSVGARFDYWQSAVRLVTESPLLGTGPGTFGKAYEKIKRPDSEMARLTHNDYLQQASDSGVIGFLLYSVFIVGSLAYTYRNGGVRQSRMKFVVWLGLLGWSLQGLVEFGLYVPALAWPAFGLMGWLIGGTANRIDNPPLDS